MKTVILAVNSGYIHTLLAPRYFLANSRGRNVSIYETNIKEPIMNVLRDLYLLKPDILSVGVYIFNVSYVRTLLAEIKKLLPEIKIIAGGYEVANDVESFSGLVDCAVRGEGDFLFARLIDECEAGKLPKIADGGEVADLDSIASPYSDEYCALGKDKIIYFESSRGCPFSCTYCMSAAAHGVRYFSLNRVFADLAQIMRFDVKLVKFVDRTFNCDMKRAAEIINHIIDNYSDRQTCFHFETDPELFDENIFSCLKRARKGLFQFELGLQSYDSKTLVAIKRHMDVERVERNIARLTQIGTAHIHVDLIAGLAEETLASFKCGFNRLIMLFPDCLQLGFLKLLKGSPLEIEGSAANFFSLPPYEVIDTPGISFEEICYLKQAEDALEKFYNSGRFKHLMRAVLPSVNPLEFFAALNVFCEKRAGKQALSAYYQCDALYLFCSEYVSDLDKNTLESLISEDYSDGGNVRKWRAPK